MEKIIEKLKEAKDIAVLGHVNADPDAIGSCFAFAHMMRSMGKNAVVYLSEVIEERLNFMGDDYVVYGGENPPHHELCVCLDSGDMGRLGYRKDIFNAADFTVSIDHHISNTYYAQLNYVDGSSPAAGEILCRLFKKMNLKLDDYAAKQLYTAICSDTGCFKFSSVTPATMREVADLLEYDFDHAEVAKLLFDSDTLPVVKFKAQLMLGLKSYFGGKITVAAITDEIMEKSGISEKEVPNIADVPRAVRGTEVAVALKERKDGIRVNLRSNGDVNVNLVAAKFGGGGHIKAAGCTIKDVTLEEAERMVVEEFREAFE